jgi:5-methylcytosine-specific restriction endonuclease McrA
MPLKDPEARREYLRLYQLRTREEQRQKRAERYENNPALAEAARQRAKEWYENNKERAAEAQRTYRAEHKEQVAATFKAWKKANKERMRELNKQSSKRRREHNNERRRKYRSANQAKTSQKNAEYYERTKEQRQAYSRKWWAENLAMARMYAHERRAREAAVGGKHAAEDAHKLWLHYDKKCAVVDCDKPIEDGGKRAGYCMDHVIPLSRGGTNDFTNFQILCKSHNSQKKNRTNEEWITLFNIHLRKVPPLNLSASASPLEQDS